ncbi:MAG TPA: Gfo/Idh/MocA family oxidoreductase [Candidatus Eisenbergiella merdipullorum]|uniref:Gfo/Idh/MocA family oxidoreductase n=1 Tax=Candidatus Eisenbergiella merdipullorum TaxID=2838553 RepID=A0A9D2KZT7_9FIRM|nr:Gfo/Idh/MocA family oxidoreductase [Candidatus Eisenbergiella merdipullorum]
MSSKLTVAVIGCGDFARNFVGLFKAHPYVEKVYVCDRIRSRAEEYSKKFQVEIADSFEEVLKRKDIQAVAIFAQRHLHGPLVISALKAGKHVYSAVPMASEVEECGEIVDLVKQTGLTYMMGETCYYYPSSMFCRQQHQNGAFGKFVYGESQYHHDISHFPENFLADKRSAGVPPFFYPTHSTAMILAAAESYVKKVVAFGYEDQEHDGIYEKGINQWDNVFSNGYSLMMLANGGTARVNECRRIGYKAPSSYVSAFYGTEGSYQFHNAQHLVTRKTEKGVLLKDVSAEVNPLEMTKHQNEPDFLERVANHEWQWDCFAPIQEAERKRLPESYLGMENGHMASHQFLIDDFCTAAFLGRQPVVNAWKAARYTVPGLMAHQSVTKGGITLDVPDFGDYEGD